MSLSNPTCWVMTSGEAGMVSQAVGLAEAVGLPFIEKRMTLLKPWRWLPGHLCTRDINKLVNKTDALEPPWPALLITCGRRSVAPAIAIRRLAAGKTFTVHIQNPRVPVSCFDMVVPPRHDCLEGKNVHPTRVALTRVTPAKLRDAAEHFRDEFAGLARPLVAVLVGGNSQSYGLQSEAATAMADRLAALVESHGAGLVVTTSRRTGADATAILRDRLRPLGAMVWDGNGENPYFGMLALADHIIVTEDSVSMVSEACATGKPVHVYPLEGGSMRLRRFHDALKEEGVTRSFSDRLETWSYEPIYETERIGRHIVCEELAAKQPALFENGHQPGSQTGDG